MQSCIIKRDGKLWRVEFLRAGKRMFGLDFKYESEATKLAGMWNKGATQGEIALVMKK